MKTTFDMNRYLSNYRVAIGNSIRAVLPADQKFMIHQEDPIEVLVCRFNEQWHLVNPELIQDGIFVEGLRQGYLYAGVTEFGRHFVLVVTKPITAESTTWFEGWQKIIKIARQQFVKVEVNKSKKRHECVGRYKFGNPSWPGAELAVWMAKAFENCRIDSADHPVCSKRYKKSSSYSQEGLEEDYC